ncbi:MAG: HEPN domain-containing protein [Candidatus Hydrogenedentales bacterium]|jgi:HEPN domain-containing protein
MIDIEKLSEHWRDGAEEDWAVSLELLSRDRVRHSLFFAHLALEKLLKAHVTRETRDVAPRIHNLVRLAEVANLKLDSGQLDALADMNEFNLEGRYPDPAIPSPTLEEAREYVKRAEEVMKWLIEQL